MALKSLERRRFIRIEVPIKVRVSAGAWSEETTTTDISPSGMGLTLRREPKDGDVCDMEMKLAEDVSPVKVRSKIVWHSRVSLEDGSPYDCGMEIVEVEESSKNILLKYLCDLLYGSSYKK